MKFVVEALGLTAGGGKLLGLRLLSELATLGQHEFVFVLPPCAEYATLGDSEVRRISVRKSQSLVGRYIFLNRTLPRICIEEGADALLCLGNFAPQAPPCPTAVLLQNAYLVYREPVTERKKTLREALIIAYGRRMYRHLPKSVQVIVQTTTMRNRLIAQYPLGAECVSVIPNAYVLPQTKAMNGAAQDSGRRHFNFLCVARYYPHKNLEVLVDALLKLPAELRRIVRCYLTIGCDQHRGAKALLKRISRNGLQDHLVNLGPVPPDELGRVYGFANAFILPSLIETVSFTYLEAMHFGLPILTSDRDFARERCKDAALYFDPLDSSSVAAAMTNIALDPDLCQTLIQAGARVAKETPTWTEIAGRFLAVLEALACGSTRPSCRRASTRDPHQAGEPSLRPEE